MMLVILIGSMRSAHAALLAEGAGGESFWVKPGVGRASSATGAKKVEGKSRVVQGEGGAAKTPPTGKESMADALAGTKSVPWSIVVGLTLLTLLPALLLSMTPLVRLLVVFPLSPAGAGHADGPIESGVDGISTHDDVVSDAAGAAGGGATGSDSVSGGDD